jgi:hypothetical protein
MKPVLVRSAGTDRVQTIYFNTILMATLDERDYIIIRG